MPGYKRLMITSVFLGSILFRAEGNAQAAQFQEFDPLEQPLPGNITCIDLRVGAEQKASGIGMLRLADLLGCSQIASVQLSVTANEPMKKRVAAKIDRLTHNPILIFCSKGVRSQEIAKYLDSELHYLSLSGGVEYLATIESFLPVAPEE